MGLFLLCWVYLRKVQQQDCACVCRGEREETEQEAQPGQSISWRIYLVPPWSRLPSAEQIKASPSSGRNLFPDASVTPNTYISFGADSADPEGCAFTGLPFSTYCQQEAVGRLQGEGKQPCCSVLKVDVCTPQEKASLQKLSISAPSSTSVALLLTTAMSFKHFFPVSLKRKK